MRLEFSLFCSCGKIFDFFRNFLESFVICFFDNWGDQACWSLNSYRHINVFVLSDKLSLPGGICSWNFHWSERGCFDDHIIYRDLDWWVFIEFFSKFEEISNFTFNRDVIMRNGLLWLEKSVCNHFSDLSIGNVNEVWCGSRSSWLLFWCLRSLSRLGKVFLNVFKYNSSTRTTSIDLSNFYSFVKSFSSRSRGCKNSIFVRILSCSFFRFLWSFGLLFVSLWSCFSSSSWCFTSSIVSKSSYIFFLTDNDCNWGT